MTVPIHSDRCFWRKFPRIAREVRERLPCHEKSAAFPAWRSLLALQLQRFVVRLPHDPLRRIIMLTVNPPASDTGKKLSPTYHVTGLFPTVQPLSPLLDDLEKAGFNDSNVELFAGPTGAERLDFKGRHQNVVMRLLGDLAMMLSDESRLQKQIDEVLRDGGIFVSLNTDGEDQKKDAAMSLLKANGGLEVTYWGPLAVEKAMAAGVA